MKRFQFRLEKLLELRRRAERDVQGELSAVQRRYRVALDEREGLREELQRRSAEFRAFRTAAAAYTARDVGEQEEYIDALASRIDDAGRRVDVVRKELEKVTGRLIEARRKRRALEILRERRLADHHILEAREERIENDEVGEWQRRLHGRIDEGVGASVRIAAAPLTAVDSEYDETELAPVSVDVDKAFFRVGRRTA